MTHTKTVHLEVLEDLVQFREILGYDQKTKYFQFQAHILVAITSLYPMKISNKMISNKISNKVSVYNSPLKHFNILEEFSLRGSDS